MANKKINELVSRTPSLTDLMLIGDPSSGYSYKTTVNDIALEVENIVAGSYVTLATAQTISGAKTFSNVLTLTSVANSPTAGSKFLILNASNAVNYRTAAEVLSDIGAQPSGSYVPTTRTLTINGTAYDLSADRTWSVGTVTSVSATAGTGISISGSPITSSGTLTITNTAPDQTVVLTSGTGINVTGTYPSFTIAATNNGTVTSVALATGTTGTDISVSGSPITSSGTITLNIPTASATNRGALSSTDWSTFNNKQGAITLTTTGSSGAATFVANTLNIPNYTLSGLGGVPTSRTLTINGTAFDLSADRSWSVGTVTSVGAIAIGSAGNDVSSSVANATTTPLLSLQLPSASASARGVLTSLDWTTFNNKQNAITLTTTGSSGAATLVGATLNIPNYTLAGLGGVSGSGTTNYIPKFTGTSAIGNSVIYENSSLIGIGTTSPSEKLHVADGIVRVSNSTATTTMNFHPNADFGAGALPTIQVISNHALQFATNNTLRMTLNTSGNLGLGVTPSAWASPFNAFDISRASIRGSQFTGGLSHNAYYNGTNFIYIASSVAATDYYQNSGQHVWQTAPSGTAGNAISFTQAMTLDASGNLGIGTTSISNRLEVSGAIRSSVASGTGTFKINNSSVSKAWSFYPTTNGSQTDLNIYEEGTTVTAMTFKSGGNIGIGTTSPGAKLTIEANQSSSSDVTYMALINPNGENCGHIDFNNTFGNLARITGTKEGGGALANDGIITFSTAINSSLTERMRITSGGEVLINTTSDAGDYKLQVNGASYYTGNTIISSASDNGYLVTNGTDYSYFSQARSTNSYITGAAASDAVVRGKNGVIIGGNNGDGSGLRIASTGAATFSSSVAAGGNISYPSGSAIYPRTTSVGDWFLLKHNASLDRIENALGTNKDFTIGNFNGSTYTANIILNGSGAATFSSSITANSLHLNGSFTAPLTTKTANYTLTSSDYTVGFDCAADRTATLPDATTCSGRIYVIYQYNTAGSTRGVTIDPNGAQTINGAATYLLKGYCEFSSVMIQSNGSNWIIISDALQTGCL